MPNADKHVIETAELRPINLHMDAKSLKTLQILEAIAEDKPMSQRDLSDALQISLGMINSFIKRLVKKGYCKVTTVPKKRARYILTPAGAMEKTRLTYAYILSSYQYFKSARCRVHDVYKQLSEQGLSRLIFYGSGELAEIAYLSLIGTGLQLLDVVDSDREGEIFEQMVVKAVSRLKRVDFDVVLIAVETDHEAAVATLKRVGVPPDKILLF